MKITEIELIPASRYLFLKVHTPTKGYMGLVSLVFGAI